VLFLRAGDFFAEDFRAVVFLRPVLLRADDFFAVDFRAVVFFRAVVLRRAGDFFAADLRAVVFFRAGDLRADDFFRAAVFLAAAIAAPFPCVPPASRPSAFSSRVSREDPLRRLVLRRRRRLDSRASHDAMRLRRRRSRSLMPPQTP